MVATTTSGPAVISLPMTLSNRGRFDEGDVARHTIRLSGNSKDGLLAEPAAPKISTGDLIQYEAASASA
jgi:hypothetical protein